MEVITINGQKRESAGTAGATVVRNSGRVPCVMYGGDAAVSFSADPAELRHLVYSAKFRTVDLKLDGKSHKCILKEIQFHPTTDAIIHLDFLELVPGKKVRAVVPIRFTGQSIGVKGGGKLIATMRNVKILTTPEKLVDEVTADITNLDLGQTIRVRDIVMPEGVAIINAAAIPIAAIEIPRALRGKK